MSASASTEVEFAIAQYFQGPLPPPAMLAEYEAVLPGMAERILRMAEERHSMAEKQSSHRQELERKVVDSNIRQEKTGQWMALCLAIGVVGGGVYCAIINQPWVAGTMVSGVLVALVTVFITGKRVGVRQIETKRKGQA